MPNNDFEPLTHGRFTGFVMLKRKNPDVASVYDEPVEEKKEEKTENNAQNNNNQPNEGYAALPQEDFDIPEDFDLDAAK